MRNKQNYGKIYLHIKEEIKREQIFFENLEFIEEHNKLSKKG